ncbi:hypothetical protein FHX42_000634 [Saccharopolyspora lacisalsi]|uniref:IrrE N-terminal-like domain-containing protein n=1 Tax=Halosaccharopolyspora lacisalsi TaxID=1000566 RepID=A0A839DVJ4_9PSEU|nr:hypothetical protein [Halosaccharopolyspora lacisalsi]MBA8823305.1 hypothetical protein [Halosaccharopolyspora lacisalsi]
MSPARLRRRCESRVRALVAAVGLPAPWHVNEFLDRLEHHRGRDIDLCEVSWKAGDSSGAWHANADHDVIAYPGNTSTVHQDHIILHEIGHLISAHRGRCVLSEQEAQRLAPDLAPAAFVHLLDRVSTTTEEQEAELIATLLHQRALHHRTQVVVDDTSSPTARRLSRLEYVFGS